MKCLLTTLLFVLLATPAMADQLEFAWGYTHTNIDGFRLYIDGSTVKEAHIAPDARVVIVEEETDGLDHAYHLTAYIGDRESVPSATVVVRPEVAEVYQIEGPITVRRIK